jgi:hypothetical protein
LRFDPTHLSGYDDALPLEEVMNPGDGVFAFVVNASTQLGISADAVA